MIGTFVLVYLIQSMDKKYKNKLNTKNIFDKFKIPLLAASIVGLSTEYFFETNVSSVSTPVLHQDIFTEVPNF